MSRQSNFSLDDMDKVADLSRSASVKAKRSQDDLDLMNSAKQKEIIVRTPKNGRSKSISILSVNDEPRNFHLARLNGYNKVMKKHCRPVSKLSNLGSQLESIIEDHQDAEGDERPANQQ